MIDYTSPSTRDLAALKEQLGYSGEQMAALASVASGAQWRKYTGGASPRELSLHMLFFMAARLALDDATLEAVRLRMQEIGADVSAIASAQASHADLDA